MALLYVFTGPKFLFALLRQTTVLRNIFLNFNYLPVLIRRSRVIHQLQSLGRHVWQRLGERDALGFHRSPVLKSSASLPASACPVSSFPSSAASFAPSSLPPVLLC